MCTLSTKNKLKFCIDDEWDIVPLALHKEWKEWEYDSGADKFDVPELSSKAGQFIWVAGEETRPEDAVNTVGMW